MLEDAADVVQRQLGQPGVAVAGEQVLAALRERLVHVHARAVVADDRLRHEGRGLAVGMRDVVHGVLEDLHPVGALHQAVELGADLALARRRTSWWCTSHSTPISCIASTIAERMSCSESTGGTGK